MARAGHHDLRAHGGPRPRTAPGSPTSTTSSTSTPNSQVIQRLVTNGVAGPEHNLGAVLYPGSTVAAAWRPDGKRLDLFGRGTESALWQKTFTWAGGWTDWTARTAPGSSPPTPSAASIAANRVDVFYRGADVNAMGFGSSMARPLSGTSSYSTSLPRPAAFVAPNGALTVAVAERASHGGRYKLAQDEVLEAVQGGGP